jgi:hypothetical protein
MTTHSITVEDRLLATYISNNPSFEEACLSGNVSKILQIANQEMEINHLHTPGAIKLYNDIRALTKGKIQVSPKVGENILFFVWNSRLSGTGFAVAT